jgi:hypothetical protein
MWFPTSGNTDAFQADFQPDLGQKSNGLLVKKWTSVIRMQKKVRSLVVYSSIFESNSLIAGGKDIGLGSSVTGSTARQLEHGCSPSWF